MFFKKKTSLDEVFVLENQHGERIEIPVLLDAATAIPRYNKAEAILENARIAVSRNPNSQEAVDALGRAALAQLAVVFGDEGVAEIYKFHHQNAEAMLRSCYPYIKKRVLPVLKAGSKARLKELKKTTRHM